MTIRVTDEGTVTKKPKHFMRTVLLIIAIPVTLYIFLFFAFVFSLVTFQVQGNLSDEKKASLASEALMPQIAEYIERFGTRGFQDIDLQIETRTFKNIDELVAVMLRAVSAATSSVSLPWCRYDPTSPQGSLLSKIKDVLLLNSKI